jgi:hypothetical protein
MASNVWILSMSLELLEQMQKQNMFIKKKKHGLFVQDWRDWIFFITAWIVEFYQIYVYSSVAAQ